MFGSARVIDPERGIFCGSSLPAAASFAIPDPEPGVVWRAVAEAGNTRPTFDAACDYCWSLPLPAWVASIRFDRYYIVRESACFWWLDNFPPCADGSQARPTTSPLKRKKTRPGGRGFAFHNPVDALRSLKHRTSARLRLTRHRYAEANAVAAALGLPTDGGDL